MIQIKLDNANLDLLFPAGSEARDILTKNVAENFLKSRLQAGVTNAVASDLDSRMATVRAQATAEAEKHFLKDEGRGWTKNWQPTPALKKIITSEVESQVSTMITQALHNAVTNNNFADGLRRKAESALRTHTEAALTTMLQQRMQAALASLQAKG